MNLYQQHFSFMTDINNQDYGDGEIDFAFDRLLKAMPNNGKLYKYRSIEEKSFEYTFDSLKNGYIWLPNVKTLNDLKEVTLNYDYKDSINELADYVRRNPVKFACFMIRLGFDQADANYGFYKVTKSVINFIDKETGIICCKKASRYLRKHLNLNNEDSISYCNRINNYIRRQKLAIEKLATSFAEYHSKLNDELREISYVYSMSSRYDLPNMWAYYGNNNKGFCIEYDYNKAVGFSIDQKKNLLSTFKVIYNDKKKYSYLPYVKLAMNDLKSKKAINQANKETLIQCVTKDKEWESESEWRIFLANLNDNRLYLDIVSGIIIDKSILDTKEAQRLKALAKDKGWHIKIRNINQMSNGFEYN